MPAGDPSEASHTREAGPLGRGRATASTPRGLPSESPRAGRHADRNVGRPARASWRSHIGWPIILFSLFTAVLGLGAVNSQNNLLFAALGLAIGVLVTSGLVSGPTTRSIRIARVAHEPASPGEPISLRYRLHNTSRILPLFAIRIEELGHLQPARRAHAQRAAARHITTPVAFVAHVGPRQSVTATSTVWASHSGTVELRGVRLSTRFPFGILRKSTDVMLPGRVVVLPLVLPVRQEPMAVVARTELSALRPTNRVGGQDEFFGLREHRSGDPVRAVAWRASARVGKLRTIERTHAGSRRLAIELEPQSLLQDAVLRRRALAVAASLAVDRSDRGVGLSLRIRGGGEIARFGVGPAHRRRMLEALAELDAELTAEPDSDQGNGPRSGRRAGSARDSAVLRLVEGSAPARAIEPGVVSVGVEHALTWLDTDDIAHELLTQAGCDTATPASSRSDRRRRQPVSREPGARA